MGIVAWIRLGGLVREAIKHVAVAEIDFSRAQASATGKRHS